jgi:MFS superfamily sulfate permease-like transporter
VGGGNDHRLIDSATWVAAIIAGVSFWQGVALAVTILAGLVSITLGCFRLYDRVRYGPENAR